MAYRYQDRLKHTGERMFQVNSELFVYSRGVKSLFWYASIARVSELDVLNLGIPADDVQRLLVVTGFAAQLVLEGQRIQPVVTDTIIRTRNQEKYQAVCPGTVQVPYRYSTTEADRIHIYFQRIPQESVVQ